MSDINPELIRNLDLPADIRREDLTIVRQVIEQIVARLETADQENRSLKDEVMHLMHDLFYIAIELNEIQAPWDLSDQLF